MGSDFKRESPCRYCSDRAVGCHGVCTDYIKWAKDRKDIVMHDRLSRPKTICKSDFTGTSPKPGKPRWKKK